MAQKKSRKNTAAGRPAAKKPAAKKPAAKKPAPKKPAPGKSRSKPAGSGKGSSRRARGKTRSGHTSEGARGGQFIRHLRTLTAIEQNHKGKPFSKKMVAEWLRDDFDHDMDDLSEWFAAKATQAGTSVTTPPSLDTIKEASRDRNAERAIKSLLKLGIQFTQTDEFGNPQRRPNPKPRPKTKRPAKGKAPAAAASPKVWWTYNPDGPVSVELRRLFTDFKITGYQLEGILGCNDLLKNLYGLPMEAQVREMFKRLTAHVPPKLMREATAQADAWRSLFRRPGKYEPLKTQLRAWTDATILRQQCTMTYAKAADAWRKYVAPDTLPRLSPRRLAAFGTVLIPEEDSIYLIGCEADRRTPGKWQPPVLYKLDRVFDLRMEDDPNPEFTDLPSHRRVGALAGNPSRLDLERLFADSFGSFFHYGETHAVELLLHDPEQITLCLERPLHRRQLVALGPGPDEVTVTVDRCFLDELVPRLLAMKAGFTVAHPPELADSIHAISTGIASRHAAVPSPTSGEKHG